MDIHNTKVNKSH